MSEFGAVALRPRGRSIALRSPPAFPLPQIKRKPPSYSSAAAPPSSAVTAAGDDPDAEEALRGFDFLCGSDEGDSSPNPAASGDGTDWGESEGERGGQ